MNVLTVAAETLAAVAGSTGFVALITAVSRKKQVKVDVASKINEMSLEWAEDIKKEAEEARAQTKATRLELETLHRRMVAIQHEFDDLTRKFRILRNAIFSPNISVEDLRALVEGYSHRDDHP